MSSITQPPPMGINGGAPDLRFPSNSALRKRFLVLLLWETRRTALRCGFPIGAAPGKRTGSDMHSVGQASPGNFVWISAASTYPRQAGTLEMVEYPFVFDHKGQRLMLYNGNGFGRTGFGLAFQEGA